MKAASTKTYDEFRVQYDEYHVIFHVRHVEHHVTVHQSRA